MESKLNGQREEEGERGCRKKEERRMKINSNFEEYNKLAFRARVSLKHLGTGKVLLLITSGDLLRNFSSRCLRNCTLKGFTGP